MNGYLGEIRIFAGNFAPRNWAFCNGQILPINSNQSLFSLFGTMYGGDGRTTFALPDLRSRVPVGIGQATGQPANFTQGEKIGTEFNILNQSQLPPHNHVGVFSGNMAMPCNNASPNDGDDPSGHYYQVVSEDTYSENPNTHLGPLSTALTAQVFNNGGGQGMENRQPVLAISFIVCLQGIFPSRN